MASALMLFCARFSLACHGHPLGVHTARSHTRFLTRRASGVLLPNQRPSLARRTRPPRAAAAAPAAPLSEPSDCADGDGAGSSAADAAVEAVAPNIELNTSVDASTARRARVGAAADTEPTAAAAVAVGVAEGADAAPGGAMTTEATEAAALGGAAAVEDGLGAGGLGLALGGMFVSRRYGCFVYDAGV